MYFEIKNKQKKKPYELLYYSFSVLPEESISNSRLICLDFKIDGIV